MCHLVIAILAKVWAGYDLSNVQEVKAFESNGSDFLLIVHIVELVKTFALVINLDPSVICQVGEDLVLSLQSKLITKLAA